MYLSDSQYENIKENVVDMYEECGLTAYPIDCMEIARRLNYRLVPYSKLKGKNGNRYEHQYGWLSYVSRG